MKNRITRGFRGWILIMAIGISSFVIAEATYTDDPVKTIRMDQGYQITIPQSWTIDQKILYDDKYYKLAVLNPGLFLPDDELTLDDFVDAVRLKDEIEGEDATGGKVVMEYHEMDEYQMLKQGDVNLPNGTWYYVRTKPWMRKMGYDLTEKEPWQVFFFKPFGKKVFLFTLFLKNRKDWDEQEDFEKNILSTIRLIDENSAVR